MTPAEHAPHSFVGRLDRWCEVCNRPDRDSIHKVATPAAHAATLLAVPFGPDSRWEKEAREVIAALAERATELERQFEKLALDEVERARLMKQRVKAAEARATELEPKLARALGRERDATERAERAERERDKARNDAALLKDEGDVFLRNVRRLEKRAERAERERDEWRRQERLAVHDAAKLETALRQIASEVGPRPGGAGRRFWNIARAALGETAPRYTMDQGAIIPTDHEPHEFVGRADRWCEVCDLPDRHPVHALGETTP